MTPFHFHAARWADRAHALVVHYEQQCHAGLSNDYYNYYNQLRQMRVFACYEREQEALAVTERAADMLRRVEQEAGCAIINQDWHVRVDLPAEISKEAGGDVED